MNRNSDLDKDQARLRGEADRAGVARPESGVRSPEPGRRASTPDTGHRPPDSVAQRPAISPSDPAVQVLESAHQILMMIGANPRAIRPILAQRRLTKEAVLEAAGSVADRATAALADLDTLKAGRRATHDDAVAQTRAQMEALAAEARPVAQSTEAAPQNDEGHRAEMARLQGQLDAANAAWTRFEADERAQRAYLTGLHERAARVSEVYQTL
jgi:hypothetical protein